MRTLITAASCLVLALLTLTVVDDARADHHESGKRAGAIAQPEGGAKAARPTEEIACRDAGTQTCCSWTVKDANGRRDTGTECVATQSGPMPEKAKMRRRSAGRKGPGDVAAGPGTGTAKPEWDVDCYKVGDETCCSWIVYYPSIDESSAGVECSGD